MVSLSLARANRDMIVWSLFVSLCDRAWLLCAQQNSKKTQKKSATRTEPNHTGTMLLSNHTNTFEILITGDLIDKSTFFDASFKINWVNLFRFENTLNELFFSSSGNKRKKWRKCTYQFPEIRCIKFWLQTDFIQKEKSHSELRNDGSLWQNDVILIQNTFLCSVINFLHYFQSNFIPNYS